MMTGLVMMTGAVMPTSRALRRSHPHNERVDWCPHLLSSALCRVPAACTDNANCTSLTTTPAGCKVGVCTGNQCTTNNVTTGACTTNPTNATCPGVCGAGGVCLDNCRECQGCSCDCCLVLLTTPSYYGFIPHHEAPGYTLVS
jgi:hypothetical protein